MPFMQCPARVDIESSRSEKWNENLFHSFREVKSEMKIWFTIFEKWKVKWKSDSLFSRNEKWNKNLIHSFREVKSEMKMPRDREVKFLENSREFKISWKFSRNSRKPKKEKVFKSRPSFFPPLAFECIVVLRPSLMTFFASFNFLHAICWI